MIAHVGVVKAGRKTLDRQLTVSSELVPFQEIDVYAKESGFVKTLLVDYGSRVRKGQLMAVLEIPELEAQLRQDDAMIRNASDRISRAKHELDRAEAQHHVAHLQAARLSTVSTTRPGLVAEQEVDDAKGKDLAEESAVESAKANVESIRSDLLGAQAKREHDGVLMDYARITAPFAGVITQRFANLGMLMQAGTNSSTQAMPLVRLSQDDLFRLVIPVPESYVKYVHVGDPIQVTVSSLNRNFPGKVARFSVDVQQQTRTMHTEVDVPNLDHVLIEGMYAEAVLRLEHRPEALSIPLQAISHEGETAGVLVVNSSNKLEERKVQVGMQTDADAEILAGLREGELVVASDRSGLKPGQEVKPQAVELMQLKGEQER
ncbi:MAG: efflux RND transporter periplasmic adaptor subunit [Bryobacteraceae bacterium]|nr:efflux RND transporter periplasmic adaptor subunit [Bryobacteraceae bacterium]